MCEIDIGNQKYTRNTWRLSSGMKILLPFWVKGFSTWGERATIFLCWLLLHRQLSTQPKRGACSAQSRLASPRSESQLSRFEAGTQLSAFLKSQKSSALPGMTSFTSSSLISYLGIFILTSVNDTSSPRAREHLR